MAGYIVLTPELDQRPDAAVLVRDGFHVMAFLLPVIWLLWHRLWIEALIAFAAAAVLSTLAGLAGFGAASPAWSLLVSIFFGLEAAHLRVLAMRRRGWRQWGVIEADSLRSAETRLVVEMADALTKRAVPFPARPATITQAGTVPSFGMFDYPGAR